ncbi:MAG: xanthine dehydrogenase family protein molybdopterin-binding subunit [Candidatus Methylomirabilia bacterium]
MTTETKLFGSSIRRREDPRLITGKGTFTDNLKIPGMVYAFIVRSPHAHARIRKIDVSVAKAHPGVIAVFTGADMQEAKVGPIPTGWLHAGIKIPPHPPIAVDKVNYVGDAVAVVLAEDRYIARDAAELVQVDYEALPAVVDMPKAVKAQPTAIHAEASDNVAFNWSIGDKEKTDAAFARADKVAKIHTVNNRLIPNAIEPRCAVAQYNSATGDLTLWMTSQNPHIHRLMVSAFILGLPEHKVRVIAPDVGGGFGSKIHIYADEVIVCWCAKMTGRPVKWTSDRRESYLTDAHGRDHVTDAEMAFSKDGKMLGLRVHTLANMGAYLSLFAPAVPTYLYGTLMSGLYAQPAIHCQVTGVFTNTVPVDAYRGAGRPEAAFVVERLVDLGARELGIDPVELRRKNFVAPDQFPFQTQVALAYDSGNYAPALDKALQVVGYQQLRQEQEKARKNGQYIGIGLSTYIEACGLAPSAVVGSLGAQAGQWESATVRVHPTGTVTVFTGSHSHGQGHETTFAQLAADELGIPIEHVEVVHGDTGAIPYGWGTYGSRSVAVGGSAIHTSLQKIKEKGRKIAAHLLEAAENDIAFEGGKFFVKGSPDRSKAWGEVVLMAYLAHNLPQGMEPALEVTSFYDPPNFTFPFGTHICVLEVDPDSGKTKLLRYVAVDDVGTVINPMIVDGQVHGGIAQGVAQALWESAVYDANGQLLSGSMMDYAVPKADDLVSFDVDRTVTPCPHNPLGVKGAGETGTIASTAAVANAVMDALAPFGITHIDMPLTPSRIWAAVQAAKGKR